MSFARLLDETCTVKRRDGGVRPTGTQVVNLATVASAVPCSFQQRSPRATFHQEGDAPVWVSAWLVFFAAGVDIKAADVLVRAKDGGLHTVTDVEDVRGHHLEVQTRKQVKA